MKMYRSIVLVFLASAIFPVCVLAEQPSTESTAKSPTQPTITILGEGLLPNVAGEGQTSQGVGSIGVAYYQRFFQAVVSISSTFQSSKVSSADQRDFGRSLLNPQNTSQALALDMRGIRIYEYLVDVFGSSGNMDAYSSKKDHLFWEYILNAFGLHGYVTFSGMKWEGLEPLLLSAQTVETNNFTAGVDLSIDIVNGTYLSNDFLMSFDFGIAIRSMFGDIIFDRDFRKALLGTTKTSFAGFEAGMTVAVNALVAKFIYTKMEGDIPGFSTGAMSVSIGVQLGVLRYPFTDAAAGK